MKREEKVTNVTPKVIGSNKHLPYARWKSTMAKLDNYLKEQEVKAKKKAQEKKDMRIVGS